MKMSMRNQLQVDCAELQREVMFCFETAIKVSDAQRDGNHEIDCLQQHFIRVSVGSTRSGIGRCSDVSMFCSAAVLLELADVSAIAL